MITMTCLIFPPDTPPFAACAEAEFGDDDFALVGDAGAAPGPDPRLHDVAIMARARKAMVVRRKSVPLLMG
jgi:hypothetical protein